MHTNTSYANMCCVESEILVRFASDDGDQYLWFGVNIATAKILTFFPLEGNSNNANEINYPLSKHDDDGDEFVPSMVLFLC